MSMVPFSQLPDHARLWVFASERPLTTDESTRLLDAVDAFLASWHAHQVPLTCARDWRHDRFLLVGADERAAGVSGCSIDALVRTMKALGHELGVQLLDHGAVHFREGDEVRRLSRDAFGEAAAAGRVSPDTRVYDNTVTSVGALRAGGWERPASTSWHQRAFFA
jgi:hypothetical protein